MHGTECAQAAAVWVLTQAESTAIRLGRFPVEGTYVLWHRHAQVSLTIRAIHAHLETQQSRVKCMPSLQECCMHLRKKAQDVPNCSVS